jgi:hypothetical protein
MQKWVQRLSPLFAVFLMGQGGDCDTPPAQATLDNVHLVAQEHDRWCWAATGEMVMNAVRPGTITAQCNEVDKVYPGSPSCCITKSAHCRQDGWPPFDEYNFHADKTNDGEALKWEDLQKQISCRKTPVAFSWLWNGGASGHIMVAFGYHKKNGRKYVELYDPLPVPGTDPTKPGGGSYYAYTYAKYKGGGSFNHTHWRDYYNVSYPAT